MRDLLDSFWPGAAAIFAAVASPIALASIERYPTPESAARLGWGRLASFLAQHQYGGRRSPAGGGRERFQSADQLAAEAGGFGRQSGSPLVIPPMSPMPMSPMPMSPGAP